MIDNTHSLSASKSSISGGRLIATIVINLAITISEIVGGILTGSLALLSDALHNFSDGFAIVLAYVAYRYSRRSSNNKQTFGYKRAEILSAFINSLILIAICIYLFYEAIHRFFEPQVIEGELMLVFAILGLVGNLACVFLLKQDKNRSINVKAAYLHLLGDTMSSVVVTIGAFLIIAFGIYWIDPLLTVAICLYILKETFDITKETIEILMQSAPKDSDIEKIRQILKSIPEVQDIHHIHLWRLNDSQIHFECHLELNVDLSVSESERIIINAEKLLLKEFNITHTTFQIEYNSRHKRNLIQNSQNCC